MKNLIKKDSQCAFVIVSCDNFSDAWEAFFTFFFKYWPDCPYKIYLISDTKVYDDPRVTTLTQGIKGKDWSSCVIDSLERIPEEYFLYVQEDYLLNGKVNTKRVQELLSFLIEKNIGCIRLYPSPPPDKPYSKTLGEITKGPRYSFSLQASLWNKAIFRSLLERGSAIRNLESDASIRAKDTVAEPFLSVLKTERPFPYFATAIKKGVWYYDAAKMCKKAGIVLDPKRKIEPLSKYIIRKLHADRLIRVLRRIRKIGKIYYKKSYAQQGEDLIIESFFKEINKDSISYLDIGAHHPYHISNTYYFYKKGSRGVCVEADETLCKFFKKKRPLDVCVSVGVGEHDDVDAKFYIMQPRGLNTFSKDEADKLVKMGHPIENVTLVPLMNINSIIEKYFKVCPDFISIDIEGLDFMILSTFDFKKYRPAIFCVETKEYKSEERRSDIIDLMKRNGYDVYADTHLNTIFYAHTLPR